MFGASAPAFGAAPAAGSTPGFCFGAAAPASTPSLFGAASSAATTTFGASPFVASTPAFGAASSASLFGAASTPAMFGAASSAAVSPFSFASQPASAPSIFGAASSASLFGAPASTPSLFGAASSASLFGAATPAPSLFGSQPAGALGAPAQQQAVTALATKDGRPITHTSKWDDLSPQTQQYLTELEKVVVQYREDCRQLDADPRLAPAAGSGAAGAREQQEEMQGQARGLSQAISALGSAVKADVEQVGALREAVLHLVRSTDTALHTFKRSHAWREAAKASAPAPSHTPDLAGPPVLPSHFLREAIAGFLERLRQHRAAVAELEAALVGSGAAGYAPRRGSQAVDGLQALQGALTNVHDCLIHTAARLQALDDRVSAAREAYLARQRAAGNTRDPFAEEERRQAKLSEQQPRSPAAQAAALHAAQHQQLGGPAAAHMPALLPAAQGTTAFGAAPSPGMAASPGGLFGTVQPSPGGAFGTPLFGQQQRSAPTSRKPSSRRK
ncbi:hypothetical protein ABPG77_008113 [Micractinium sp. CCAP 211/92]